MQLNMELSELKSKVFKLETEKKTDQDKYKECVIEMSRDFIIDYNKLLHKNANQNLDKSF